MLIHNMNSGGMSEIPMHDRPSGPNSKPGTVQTQWK